MGNVVGLVDVLADDLHVSIADVVGAERLTDGVADVENCLGDFASVHARTSSRRKHASARCDGGNDPEGEGEDWQNVDAQERVHAGYH